ncbi:VOC family protein [Propionibacteriaceae bacterium G1746]|uniref:VOC family protein n=1 Tax=Aestuariimicrobium sp. G57 TaxID=3418485 RepID=UPI003C2929F9
MTTPAEDLGNLDHLVITVPDLAAACDEFAMRLGVRPEAGGKHPRTGTHNALFGLTDEAYVELIAVDPQVVPGHPNPPFKLAGVNGISLCTFAAHPGDLESAAAGLLGLGFDVGPLGPGRRTTPDGVELAWTLSEPLHADASGIVPFLIDWLGGPSPAATVGPRAAVTAWGASAPDPEPYRVALESLGVPLSVDEGDFGIWVEFTGPAGTWRV